MNTGYLAACCLAGLALLVVVSGPLTFRDWYDRELVWWGGFCLAVAASVVAVATMAGVGHGA